MDHFVKPKLGPETERTVIDTHKYPLSHKGTSTHTSPDFVVSGTGPYFEIPLGGKETGYSNTVAFFDAKRDRYMSPAANLRQASVYVRYVNSFLWGTCARLTVIRDDWPI